jgi:hypothetical protein
LTGAAEEPQPRPSLLGRVVNELTVAVGLAAGASLATGYALTWAQVANEGMPPQVILASLPRTFFVQVALEAMLAPLVTLAVVAVVWVGLVIPFTKHGKVRFDPGSWAAFGAVVAGLSWLVARAFNGSSGGFAPGAGLRILCAGVVLGALLAAGTAKASQGLLSARYAGDLRRPVAAVALVLCFFIACAVRIADAGFVDGALPVEQAIVEGPCASIMGGRQLDRPAAVDARGGATTPDVDRCLVAGFYLGANDTSVFLVQRTHRCRSRRGPPRLLVVPRDRVHLQILLREADLPEEECKV